MRSAVIALAGASLTLSSLSAAAQMTTPGEAHPHYRAMVTIEEGVRVFRPLRPRDRIIDPDGKEQVSLGSSQPDTCACNRTYLHQVGSEAGYNRYLRRIEAMQPLSGPR